MDVLWMLDTIALQGPEIIAVAEIGEQLFENRPITVAACRPKLALEMAPQIGLDAVIVDLGVVDIDEKHGLVRGDHAHALSR